MDTDVLFEPVRLGAATAKNRLMFVSTTNNLNERGQVTDALVAFYEERAKGGVGSIVTESMAAHPTAVSGHQIQRLAPFDRASIPGLARLANAVHRHGVTMLGQLHHGGRQHLSDSIPLLLAPSPLACPRSGGVPHVLDTDEVAELTSSFVTSGINLAEAGFDGVEIHASHGHLIGQFLSETLNTRTDRYGGSLENRMRFLMDIIERIRTSCPRELVVGVRIGIDEPVVGGIAPDEGARLLQVLEASGTIDYLSVSTGVFERIEDHIPDRHFEPGQFLHYPAGVKRAAPSLPVVGCGKILTTDTAIKAVKEGQVDIVGLSRPLIVDPAWPRKAREGRALEIRYCISCNQCWGDVVALRPIRCVHNAAAGRETVWGSGTLKPAGESRRVVIVGAGPAGLEAARIAAKRGHTVIVFEQHRRVGGAIASAATIPGNAEVGHVIDYLSEAAPRAGAEIRLGRPATAQMILDELPDAVVIACGATDRTDLLGAPEDFPVYGPQSVIADRSIGGGRTIVFDEDGYYPAVEIAGLLARRESNVHLVTRFPQVGREIPFAPRNSALRALDQAGVELVPNAWFARVEGRDVVLRHYLSGREWTLPAIDLLVHVGASQPRDELYHELRDKVAVVRRIGDAYMPRRIADAITEGHEIGRAL